MPSSITYLRLDSSNDPLFTNNTILADQDAVIQAIKTRLLLFEGEWWENLSLGTPMFQDILGKPANSGNQEIMSLALSQRIAGTPYVTAVLGVSISFNPQTRQFKFSATVTTAFSSTPVTIPLTPGSLGGS